MKLIQDFLKLRRRRQTVRELRALSPEQLHDIGIEPHRSLDDLVSGMLAAQEAERPERRQCEADFRAPAAATG